MKRRFRHWVFCALIAIGSTLATWSLSTVKFFQIINLKAYDTQFVLRGLFRGPQTTNNIILLTGD